MIEEHVVTQSIDINIPLATLVFLFFSDPNETNYC